MNSLIEIIQDWARQLSESKDLSHQEPNRLDENEDLIVFSNKYFDRFRCGEFDFIDLGTCDGGGFIIAERQGGKKGLGFNLEPSAVRRALDKGLDVALYDICELKTNAPCTDFAVYSHILEHLPTSQHIENLLNVLITPC